MNKNLTFKIKFNVDSASLRRVKRSVEESVTSTNKLGDKMRSFDENVKKSTTSIDKMKQKLKDSNSVLNKLISGMKRLAATYLGKMGFDAMIETADMLTSAQNKLNYINAQNFGAAGVTTDASGKEIYSDLTFGATEQAMEKIFNAANQSRMGYTDMAENVGKSLTLAGAAFDNNIDKAIKFQKIMSEAYTIGGASAQQKSSSMYQLIQALGSGRLQGDELRSVAEGAQVAYHEIEKYAQALYGTTDSIKEMGSKGMLTADVVVNAIMGIEDEMENAFQKTTMTFEQARTRIVNEATRAFQPLMKKMTEWLNSEQGQKAINILIDLLYKLAHVLEKVLDVTIKIMNYIIDHENTARKVIGGITALLGGKLFFSLLSLRKELLAVTGITKTLVKIFPGLEGAAGALGAVKGGLAAVAGVLGPLGVMFGLLVAACWIASDSTEDFLGRLAGNIRAVGVGLYDFFAVLGKTIASILVMIVGGFINFWITVGNVLEGMIQVAITVAHNIKTAFMNVLSDLENGFAKFARFAGNALVYVAKAANTLIPALNIDTSGLEKTVNSIGNKKHRDYESVKGAWNKGVNTYDLAPVGKALDKITNSDLLKIYNIDDQYKKGYKWGYNLLGKGKDTTSVLDTTLGTLDDYMANALGNDTKTSTDPTEKAIKDTADNTGDIADNISATTEDLSYLRKVAEMEWKRDYTNYNIEIAMTNNNNISKEADVDQITNALSAKLAEVAGNSAAGLHY